MSWSIGKAVLVGLLVTVALGAGAAVAQPDPPDEFWAEVIDNDVKITHNNAFYNCGIAGVEFELTDEEPGAIAVTETAIEGEPMDCYCHFIASFWLWNIEPGDWIVRLTYLEWPVVEWVTVDIPFTIEGTQPADPLQIGEFEKSDCLEFPTSVPDDLRVPLVWSAMKALYR